MTGTGAAVRKLAGYADEYQTHVFDDALSEFDLTRRSLLDADPATSLQFFFRRYGFDLRRYGFDRHKAPRDIYTKNANRALEAATTGKQIDLDELWEQFVRECECTNLAVSEAETRSIVVDTARLVDREGNLFRWVEREVDDHGRLTVPYDELTAITGIGPRLTKSFLRDAVWVCGVENRVRGPDRRRLQPMADWVSTVAEALWPRLEGADDVLLAKRIVDACGNAGVSGVEFNQGASYFGREAVGDRDAVAARVRELRETPVGDSVR